MRKGKPYADRFISMKTALKLHSHSGHIYTRIFPASINGHSLDNAVCLSGDFISVSTISNSYSDSQRESSICSLGKEKSRRHWVNYQGTETDHTHSTHSGKCFLTGEWCTL